MSWVEDINSALNYIEKNLRLDISLDKIAKEAGCSKYNFERLFSFITGYSLSFYIKKRIMDEATKELIINKLSITDIALKYGYETPSSFSRAYKKITNISPKNVLKFGSTLTSFSALYYETNLKGVNEMKFKLEREDNIILHGISRDFTNINMENFVEIPNMWNEIAKNGELEKLTKTCDSNSKFKAVFGVCYSMNTECNKFKYMIGVPGNSKDYEEVKIIEQLYAKFTCRGVQNIQDTTRKIFGDWLPNSIYKHANSPEIEYYPELPDNDGEMICEIWIPVVKK